MSSHSQSVGFQSVGLQSVGDPPDCTARALRPNTLVPFRDRIGPWLAVGRNVFALAVLIGAGTLGLGLWIIASDYAETRSRAERSLANLAIALERDIARNIDLYDIAMRETADALSLPGLADASPELRHAALFSRIATADDLSSILVINAAGTIAYDSDGLVPRTANLADREYFRVFRDRPGDDLYISRPIRSQIDEQREVLVFSRRIEAPDHAFAGVVAGAVQLDYFHHLFSQLELGQGGAITLFRTDGTLIMRYPASAGQTGRNIAGREPFRTMQASASGMMDGTSAVDGVERIYAFRHIGRFPLMITASGARATVFAAWRQKSVFILAAIGLLLGLSTVLLIALRRQLARAAHAEGRALASAAQAARSERGVAAAFSRLDTLFQHSADIQFVASRRADGRFAFDLLNRRGEAFTGLRATDLLGKTLDECLPHETAATVAANWDRCIEAGEPISYEQDLHLPIGRRQWETLLVPVRDTDGSICRLVGTTRDVTRRKQAEDALLRLNSTLERRATAAVAAQDDALVRASTAERLQVLGQLASGVAHDFNNVLQSVTSGTALIERRADDPVSMRKVARMIDAAASRGASITERLLAFSRDDAADGEPVAVAPMLADVADILRHTLRGTAPIEIATEILDPTLTVAAEMNQLQTVLLNLATNARDAMPDGGTITLGAAPFVPAPDEAFAPGSYVHLWVRDDGFGMDAALLARVTEPFFTTKPVGHGTGLGLSMAKTYADEAGGRLLITSRPGLGTTVNLWLRGVETGISE